MTQQYQVLARKYRPKNFHELIGQTHVSQALINAIDYNRLHHAYLFTGTRGVGKTTIARILSKCLNCDTGITSTPCGVCDNCVAIDQGRFIDLIEIDAASRTKVEDTRELLDNVPYAPSQGRYKVYLIDEVHMLSTHSFNALLKTLEEPPEHVKFLLATTDPQKLPITIISRCLQFVLRPLPQSLLSEHLANVLTQEHVEFTQPALWQLASAAKGSVRDAMSLTDQAIAFGQGALDDVTVNAMLGLIDAADLVRLITDIYNHDKSAVAAHIEQMRAQMVDASSMFDGLAELLHQLALTQLLPEVALNVNESQAEVIMTLAQHISPDVLQLYYEIVVQAREGIKLASTPMQALEMCILRLLAFRPLPVNQILATDFESSNQPITAAEKVSSNSELQAYDIDYLESPDSNEHPSLAGFDDIDNSDLIDNGNSAYDLIAEEANIKKVSIDLDDSAHYQESLEGQASDNNDALTEAEITTSGLNISIATNAVEDSDIFEETATSDLIQQETKHSLNDSLAADFINIPVQAQAEVKEQTIEQENFESELKSQDGSNAKSEVLVLTETMQDNQDLKDHVDDPRNLLRCTIQELNGEWTSEKWDYWLQCARDDGNLASDELALARQGMMTGQCNGESIFITNVDSKHLQTIFEQLSSKLQQQFSQAEISLQINNNLNQTKGKTPESRQQLRLEQATAAAQTMLQQSAVMQYLTDRGEGKMGKVKLI